MSYELHKHHTKSIDVTWTPETSDEIQRAKWIWDIEQISETLHNIQICYINFKEIIESVIEVFENASLGYKEDFSEDGRRIFLPENHDDQYLTFRLALVFEEIQIA